MTESPASGRSRGTRLEIVAVAYTCFSPCRELERRHQITPSRHLFHWHLFQKVVNVIGLAPATSSIQRTRSQRFEAQITPSWKSGYLQVVEKMVVDLVGLAPSVFNEK